MLNGLHLSKSIGPGLFLSGLVLEQSLYLQEWTASQFVGTLLFTLSPELYLLCLCWKYGLLNLEEKTLLLWFGTV